MRLGASDGDSRPVQRPQRPDHNCPGTQNRRASLCGGGRQAKLRSPRRDRLVSTSAPGSAGLDYVRLMVRVLEGAPDIILFGCGGGALASELHNRGCRMTVVDDNPISFEIARRYFWMPASILCVVDGMAEFLEKGSGEYAAIGVDVGGPSFDYEATLDSGHALCWAGVLRAAAGSPSTSPATGLRTLPSCGSRTGFSMRTSMRGFLKRPRAKVEAQLSWRPNRLQR